MITLPFVSVIITTKNEEKNIGNCLTSIKNQTYPQDKIEIIVVDNNSTDKTKEIALSFCHPDNPILKVFNNGPERSAQRNFGIKKAQGKYILFLDADMSLSPKVIEECVNKFIKSESQQVHKVGLYIPERILGNSYWCQVRNFERSFYDATVVDCVRFLPKNVWQKVGGFDENLTGPEDWDFNKKVKKQGEIDIIPSLLYHAEKDFTFKGYLAGKEYYGRDFKKYQEKWDKNDPEITKQFSFFYRYFGVFMEKGGWRKLLSHPLLSLGMYFLRVSIGFTYLKQQLI